MDFIDLIAKVGFPIAAAISGGYFIFLTLKFILAGVMSAVQDIGIKLVALDNRVRVMNNDVIKIDAVVSNALGLHVDVARLSRSNGKEDARKD